MNIGLADGGKAKLVGMVRDIMVDIDGFKFEINVIVSKDIRKARPPIDSRTTILGNR
jgi:hypothetical protein